MESYGERLVHFEKKSLFNLIGYLEEKKKKTPIMERTMSPHKPDEVMTSPLVSDVNSDS